MSAGGWAGLALGVGADSDLYPKSQPLSPLFCRNPCPQRREICPRPHCAQPQRSWHVPSRLRGGAEERGTGESQHHPGPENQHLTLPTVGFCLRTGILPQGSGSDTPAVCTQVCTKGPCRARLSGERKGWDQGGR